MPAWSCALILSFAVRIVAPRVDASVLFSSHVVAPPSVDHAVAFGRLTQADLLETNIAQTLEACWVCDVCAGRL